MNNEKLPDKGKPAREQSAAELSACVAAWNARQRELYGEPNTPDTRAKARSQRYYEAHKDEIAQKARDRRERHSVEYAMAKEALAGPPVNETLLQRDLRLWNAKERARVAAEDAAAEVRRATPAYRAAKAYREAHKEELAAKARQRRALAKLLT